MPNRTIEKSAPLNRDRVILGKAAAPVRLADAARPGAAAPAADLDRAAELAGLRGQLEQRDRRIAALEQQIGAREHEIAALERELEALRHSGAEREAELDGLRADIDAEREQARRQGREEGTGAAREAVLQRWREQSAQWDGALAELGAHIEQHLQTLRASAGEVALAAAVKVIGERLAEPAHIAPAVEHILRESGLSGPLTVWLAPAHYQELRRAGSVLAGADSIELRADAQVRYGGCVLESAGLVVDGRFEIQLRKLADIVRAATAGAAP